MPENKRRRDNKTVEQKEQDRLYQQGYRAAMKDEGKDDYLEKDRVRKRNKTKADIRKREADERERDEANATGDIGEKRAKKDGKKK